METTIQTEISINNIENVFDNCTDICNVRFYKPLVSVDDTTDVNIPIPYEIRIRHNDNEDAKELLNKALFIDNVSTTIKEVTDSLISTEQKNIIIAEYLGFQKTDLGWYDNEEHLHGFEEDNTFDRLKFDKDWNWLMAGVKAIVNCGVAGGVTYALFNSVANAELEKSFEEVVNFITWLKNRNK